MPLSEDEQRILSAIEQQFYDSDPAFAGELGKTTLYSHALRNLKWATATFVLGVVILVAALLVTETFLVSFGGFVVMLASALWFERNARKLGRVGLQQVTRSMHTAGLREYLGSTGQRMRDRFNKNDEA
ncbi:hypothetical protein BH20ACT2_BH20ACT2_03810 [soil metagenome]